ncbi:FUSC family protein [Xanthobacter autotrophicus DSM 431]|uniref:FUSC family protein n=1 Tax=Xanthobacter nonsaccharivorans TaxID=3119912 RepID=UPI00372743CF
MRARDTFAALGFDLPRLTFAMRTALASCAALLIASLLGLDHPQWAAMTVWAASQPTRGQLIEKSFFRVAGTLSGVIAGILLMLASRGDPMLLIAGLSLWIALCAGIGNLQRGFVAYGTILAGYSASMVTLLDSHHPDHVFTLGLDRFVTILVGVGLALAFGLLFAPRQGEAEMTGRLRHITARLLRHVKRGYDQPDDARLLAEQADLLADMAAIEEALEPHGAGSLGSRRQVRSARALLMADIALLPLVRRPTTGAPDPVLVQALDRAIAGLETGAETAAITTDLDAAARASSADPRLSDALGAISAAFAAVFGAEAETGRAAPFVPVILHKDWVGARWALVRALLAMLAVGAFWLASGWSGGPFLLLGTSIMISLFSTFENPARTMLFVAGGQAIGAAGALACRFLVWPFAHDTMGLVLLTMPFILVAPLFFSHRRTLPMAFDYAMVSLLLLHPAYPPTDSIADMANAALAVVAAPLVAMGAYRLLFPIDAGRRLDAMVAMMVRELEQMARSPDAAAHRITWRARLYHRLLGLSRLAGRAGTSRGAVVDGGLAVLATGSAILALREASARTGPATLPPALARSFKLALGRLAHIGPSPARAASALARAARRAEALGRPEAAVLAGGARALVLHDAFFRGSPRIDARG